MQLLALIHLIMSLLSIEILSRSARAILWLLQRPQAMIVLAVGADNVDANDSPTPDHMLMYKWNWFFDQKWSEIGSTDIAR